MTREIIRIDALQLYIPDIDEQPLAAFVAQLTASLQSVPEHLRGSIRIEMKSDSDWLHACYYRPETNEEMAQRQEEEDAFTAADELKERRLLDELKQKFEGTQ